MRSRKVAALSACVLAVSLSGAYLSCHARRVPPAAPRDRVRAAAESTGLSWKENPNNAAAEVYFLYRPGVDPAPLRFAPRSSPRWAGAVRVYFPGPHDRPDAPAPGDPARVIAGGAEVSGDPELVAAVAGALAGD